MDAKLKKTLRGISLEIRRLLEGRYDEHGHWQGGDLERRLNEMGLWRDRNAKPVEELPHLSAEDKTARRLVDGYLELREEAGVGREEAVSEFVRESAYSWANRLFALRCMEARGVIDDEVILQKNAYGGRSLVHNRFAKKNPVACEGEDDGLFAVLFAEFEQRAKDLPLLFDPKSPAVALRPSIAALKKTIALLSGREAARGQDAATDDVFAAPDAFGWAYQYWNADEKDRVFEMVRTKKGAKIQGADIIPATQLYTEPYMVKFLVQNSLGALWMGMYPDSKLCEQWEYYVKDADRTQVTRKPVREITFLDPAQGSGHFHLEAFDLFYAMYAEEAVREGLTPSPRVICAAILNQNLYGIDIDGRSVQIATAALWMTAKERGPELEASDLTNFHEHLVATNIRLPKERNHLELFLQKHPEDKDLRPALELVFQGLEHADELGALLQIEELVDAVLRRLKDEADKKKGTAVQPGLFEPTLVQGMLPMSVENFDEWKRDALNRLQAHFAAEAQTADPVQAFFGESAGIGLTLFNLLARRYDVVTANPPYMGSKNMGDELKAYVTRYFAPGKRDLYTTFILRCRDLAALGGRVAMVTQQSWMFLKSFSALRAVDEEKLASLRDGDFRGILRDTTIETLAHLGPSAFGEISGEVVNSALFVLSNQVPRETHRLKAFRIVAPKGPAEKAALIRGFGRGISFSVPNRWLLDTPGSPIVYWVRRRFFELLSAPETCGQVCELTDGASAADRFVRFFWEVPFGTPRWPIYQKGGGYKKWFGFNVFVCDWQANAAKIRHYILERYPPEKFSLKFKPFDRSITWITWSDVASGAMGARLASPGDILGSKGPGISASGVTSSALLALLNNRVFTYVLRLTSTTMQFSYPSVRDAVFNRISDTNVLNSVEAAVALKKSLCAGDSLESTFSPATIARAQPESSRRLAANQIMLSETAVLHTVEGIIETEMTTAFLLDSEDSASVIDETGRPAGWFPIVGGYDSTPPLPEDLSSVSSLITERIKRHERCNLGEVEVAALKQRLQEQFEAGPGTNTDADETEETSDDETDEDDALTPGAHLPIPTETFLEELSQKLELHPISVFWLLKEGIEEEGWRCLPEERRLTQDRFTVLVLRLLGHRWPKQLEVGEPLPAWADQDGVIPLTSCGGETRLIERVEGRLLEEFPGGNVAALKREFEEIVGVLLEHWLSGPFLERHIKQFKKRPIVWQIETDARGQRSEGTKKKRGEAAKPGFACLIYSQQLHAGLLPKIRTHYIGVLLAGYETELRTLEKLANPTPDQQGRKLQLDQWIEEMKAFDLKLEQVALTGFGPATLRSALRQYAIHDALLSLTACWLSKLEETISGNTLKEWQNAASDTKLHAEFPAWIGSAFTRLDYFCATVGPKPPAQETLIDDPTSEDLAPLVCVSPTNTVRQVLNLACQRWWQKFDGVLLAPLKEKLKRAREEQKRVKEELGLEEVKRNYARQKELADRKDDLKDEIKSLREDIEEKADKGKELRSQIESWTYPDAVTWEDWLCKQPLFDLVASLDGKRKPPMTIAEFIAQESVYAPDINDGVRVNIAPVQKAGLLHADVLDSKDADKAIADRAEWRADERRWAREGKLPQPGWWVPTKDTI